MGIEATGGGDTPESVLMGLTEITKFRWSRKADRHIVVIADAEDRPDEREQTIELLKNLTRQCFTTHYIQVRKTDIFCPL